MKHIAVTGGSGFVGRHLIGELVQRYPNALITSISRSEGAISRLMMADSADRVQIVMADIRDSHAVKNALKGVDTLLHLAAMKRVDLSEEQCHEAVSINVTGTMNLLDAFSGHTFVLMSTDKAVEPCNCYGATKLVAEKLVAERAKKQDPAGRYMIIRSGNVLNSTGSVLEMWKQQIETTNEITVTDPKMTRYVTSVEGLVKLFLAVLEKGENGRVYITPRGKAISVEDMAREVIERHGNRDTRVAVVGMRHGERLHEKLCFDHENVISGLEECLPEVMAASAVE